MNKQFITLIAAFTEDYMAESIALSVTIKHAKRNVKYQLEKKAWERLSPIIDNMFTEGIKVSNVVIQKDILDLVNLMEVPFKYDKTVIETINGKSVFNGWYDKEYKALYKKREIDAMKRTILRGKYSGWSDTKLAEEIRGTVRISKNRALVTARMETQRLETGVQQIYYNKPAVKKLYDKIWVSKPNARPDHLKMNGVVADKDGWFNTPAGKTYGPPYPGSFGCRCTTKLVKKVK